MHEMKRRSIYKRILVIVALIVTCSIIITGVVAVISMRNIVDKSSQSLIDQMETNLYDIVLGKAEYVESQLERYADYTSDCSTYIHELYSTPENYVRRSIELPKAENAGKFVMQKALCDDSVTWEDVKNEETLLSNSEQMFYPILSSHRDVTCSFYFGTESGIILAYDTLSNIKQDMLYYDYKSTNWYTLAKEAGEVCFTDVYQDAFGKGLTITCAAPFYDENDNFAGVFAMDILISDLYDKFLEINLNDVTAILVDKNGKVINKDGIDMDLDNERGIDTAVADKIRTGGKGVSLTENGVYYAYAPISTGSWEYSLYVDEGTILAPVTEMAGDIYNAIVRFFGIIVIIMLVVTLVVRQFSESITEPLLNLGKDVRIISGGDLEHRAKIRYNDEVGDLADGFNNMADALNNYISDIRMITAEKERIGAELNVATQIQADMLPRIFPPYPDRTEFDIYASMTPAKEVGGDFYDFFLIDDDHIALVMADVSGKGVPAALFMVIAKTLIKNRAQTSFSPAEILRDVNEQLCEGNDAELFVTVWLGILEISTGKGKAANAGHEHPVIRRAGGKYELVVYRHSPAVATMEGIKFREHDFEMHPGDSLFVYTDGVAEATDLNNTLYGTDRMLEALNSQPDADSHMLLKNVKDSVDRFVGTAPQFDDITMLGFTYFGSEGKSDAKT